MRELDRTVTQNDGGSIGWWSRAAGAGLGCHLLRTVIIGLLMLSVIGIPVAVRKYVDWQFIQQTIFFEDASIRGALERSTDVVRGRWWRTARVTLFFFLVSMVARQKH